MTPTPKLVWLIDDNEIDQRLYKRIIARASVDWQVQVFTFAEDALEVLKGQPDRPVDLIFLDINMPRMNGFEFLEAAIADHGRGFARVVVAMLTTSLDPADRRRAESYEVVKEFISKPLTVEIVQEADRRLESDHWAASPGEGQS